MEQEQERELERELGQERELGLEPMTKKETLESLLASLESRFDEKFPEDTLGHKHTERCEWICSLRPDIKSFIKQSHEEIVQAVVEAIEAERQDPEKNSYAQFAKFLDGGERLEIAARGWNAALDKIKSLLPLVEQTNK